MGIFEAILVFSISWWLVFLPVLSAGTRSQHEAGAIVPGTDPAAPETIRFRTKLLAATVGAALITFLVWATLKIGFLNFIAAPPQ
jgi:predicted secreted protein